MSVHAREVGLVGASGGSLGVLGEELAANYLESVGFVVLERNFRRKTGEIDVVARDGDTVVFVEVKTRRSGRFGWAVEQVTAGKRRRLVRTALAYVVERGMAGAECRFDVVAVDIRPVGPPAISLIKGAFDCRR
ncbi:MAG: YraN family protein [Firmicutes bacterium]|jgi:putative endonuclease|nr:YraN family protein [Bacillota bacterium]MDH7494922.1 YraN family protein [Bacillota bacterium]